MANALTTDTRTDNRTVIKQIETPTASFTNYIDDSTDPEELELTEEDSFDDPLEADEESDDYSDEEYSNGADAFSIQPIWILHEGQILWSASHYGFNLAPKEYFRRRIQTLLNFLAEKFPGKSYGELLLSLQGFFVRDNEASKGSWLDSLKNSGIIYFDEETKKYCVMPLGNLRAGKGQGKILPGKIESLWLEREFSKIRSFYGSQIDLEKHKDFIIGSFKKFCAELSSLCSVFDSQEAEEDSDKGQKNGIGLKQTEFVYEESTLYRKKFGEWKKLWSKK